MSEHQKDTFWVRLRRYFLSGLVVLLPLGGTIFLFYLLVGTADQLLGKYIEPYFREHFGFYIHGLGILLATYLIVVMGFFATHFLGKKIYDAMERLLVKLPFFRQVYPAIKELAMFLFSRNKLSGFKQVVLVEYPRKGIYSFGFLTNESSPRLSGPVKEEMHNVFIPSAPAPWTGYLIFVPKKDLIYVDITIEEAAKCILSGGVVNPAGGVSDLKE